MTKHEYSQLLMQLLTPTLPFYSPQKARLCPGSSAAVYDMAAAGAEGFARPLWGLSPSGPEEAAVLNLSSCICQALPQAPILKTRNIGAAFRILTSALWKWLPSPTAY